MFSNLRRHFGTAGLVVAITALVAALAGGAYAASGGLTSKQKKEVTSIAKQFAGKPGAPGAPGSPGTAGTNGTNGKDGHNGSDGNDGSDGKSVEAEAASVAECDSGGTKFKVGGVIKGKACNGVEGSPWVAGGVLPSEQTETGTWGGSFKENQSAFIPVSLPFPIEPAPEPVLVEAGDTTGTGCPGVVNGVPTADPGKICLYTGLESGNAEADSVFFVTPLEFNLGAAPSGTLLNFVCLAASCSWFGTWAATAPSS